MVQSDYVVTTSFTINQDSKVDTYPLPRMEESFATMSNGKGFTELDMSQAYPWMISQGDNINTHTKTCSNTIECIISTSYIPEMYGKPSLGL